VRRPLFAVKGGFENFGLQVTASKQAVVAGWFVYKPKIPIWVNFEGLWNGECWVIWNILRPFGNLLVIWYIFPRFGILCQEKSGNHDTEMINIVRMTREIAKCSTFCKKGKNFLWRMVARFFLVHHFKIGKNIPKGHKIHQIAK
jgi:hypothetical protein